MEIGLFKGESPLAELGTEIVQVGCVVPGEQLPRTVFKMNHFGITGVAGLRAAGEGDVFRIQNVFEDHA